MNATLLNRPADPAILFAEEAEDLLLECRNWLDGDPIETEEQANAVSSLLNRLRRLSKDADEARKAEKKPHDDAGKAVQAKWTPIINKADLATTTAKQALAPYLRAVEEKLARDAAILRENAAKLAEEAAQAHRGASGNLSAAEQAEELLRASGEAAKEAARADKQKAHAKGGERAVGLVDNWQPTLIDPAAALAHYRATVPNELKIWLLDQARQDVRGGARAIPGFDVKNERTAR